MISEFIQKLTVKVEADTSEGSSQGSGVLFYLNEQYFVFTAHHCIKDALAENIKISWQETYTSELILISVMKVIDRDAHEDWAIIEVETNLVDASNCNYKLGIHFLSEEKVDFCGYQNIVKNEFRPWNAQVLTVADNQFKISLNKDTFQQSGEDGVYVAKGLSGSGVFTERNKSIYLLGIVCKLQDKEGWNDDINCSSMKSIAERLSIECFDLGNFKNLQSWADDIEKNATEQVIEEWKRQNIDEFKNINRKNIVLYDSEQEANRRTDDNVKRYLSMKHKIESYEKHYPDLFLRFKNLVRKFQIEVEETYSRNVESVNQAKDIKKELSKDLREEIANIFTKESQIPLDLSQQQITEWLLDCSFNLTNND